MATPLTTTNPTASAPNGVAGFFSFLSGALGNAVGQIASNALAEQNARSQAKVQAILNANHAVNPATGPNDPAAAQNAANRTFLEKFLPSSMLYNTDQSGVKTPTMTYYGIIAGVGLLFVLIVVRLIRR